MEAKVIYWVKTGGMKMIVVEAETEGGIVDKVEKILAQQGLNADECNAMYSVTKK